jgi:hypothetical protein
MVTQILQKAKEITTPSQFKWFYILDKGKKIIRHVTSWLWNLTKAKYKNIHLSS